MLGLVRDGRDERGGRGEVRHGHLDDEEAS